MGKVAAENVQQSNVYTWPQVAIEDLSTTVSKGTTPTTLGHEFTSSGIPFLRGEDVLGRAIQPDNVAYHISPETHSSLKRSQLKPGDLLITIAGTLGRIGYVPSNAGELNCNQAVAFIRLKPELIDLQYACLVCQFPDVLNTLLDLKKIGTIGNLNLQQIREMQIPLPPLEEQRRIANIAMRADRLRRTRRYTQQLSDTYLQSVFLEMFGDPVSNPKGWDTATFGELKTDFIYGTSTKCSEDLQGLPVLRIPNILNDEIDLSNLKYAELPTKEVEKLSLQKGDLLFVRTNGNLDYVGRCAIFNLERPYLFASYLIRARLNLKKIDPVYVGAFLRTSLGRKMMTPFIRTTAGQFNISTTGLRQIKLLLPPLPLQQKFATIVQQFQRLRTQQQETDRQAEHLFQSILHRAFRGEL